MNTNIVTPQTMSIEALVEAYTQLTSTYEDLEAHLSILKEEMLARLDAEKVDGKVVNGYGVKKQTRTTFKTTIAEAEELGAIKKAVDTDALKALQKKGVEIPGVSQTTFITVRPLSVKDQA